MADPVFPNPELTARVDQIEQRVLSDLGDGRGSGNVWRHVKENSSSLERLGKALVEVGNKLKESQATDRDSLLSQIRLLEDRLTSYDSKCQNILGRIDVIQETDARQTRDIEALMDMNEKQQRQIEALTDRLNGKGLLQVDPYEKVVAQVRQTSEIMQGGEGQLSFAQVRNSIQNTQFLGKVLYTAIGLFGIGGVAAAGLTLFGVEKVPPEVQALQQKVSDLRHDVDKLHDGWNADIQRRLSEAGKK
jgi:hypothetical protein